MEKSKISLKENIKKKHLSLYFDECAFRIMKQRKNAYMKKENKDKLNWSYFVMIKVLS